MKTPYLIFDEELTVWTSPAPPEKDDYQSIEDHLLVAIRWNEEQNCFERLVCEGYVADDEEVARGDPDEEPEVKWDTHWVKI